METVNTLLRQRPVQTPVRMPGDRAIAWFSCGAASAVAAKIALNEYGEKCEIVYCDTSSDEHPDNLRFLNDCENWFERKIVRLKSKEFADRWEVYLKTNYLVGHIGARCTTELKKKLRFEYQQPDDLHIFGFTLEERHRINRLKKNNPELYVYFPLLTHSIKKNDCYAMLAKAGIELPEMYKMGYSNNNCIGCVKGQAGYWNKIRKDFPDVFDRMAKEERRLNISCVRMMRDGKTVSVFLDELKPDTGNYNHEPDISCDILCHATYHKIEAI